VETPKAPVAPAADNTAAAKAKEPADHPAAAK
jgi:hypothetical protein